MAGSDGFRDEGLTIQDVIFRAQMDIISLSGKIHTLEGNGQNIDNFYAMVRTTWAIILFWLPDEVRAEKQALYDGFNGQYEELKKSTQGHAELDPARIINLKFNLTVKLLEMMSESLAKTGILKERMAEAYTGTGEIKIVDGRVVPEDELE